MSEMNNHQNGHPPHPITTWIAQHAMAIIMATIAGIGSYYTLKSTVEVNKNQILQNREEIKAVRTEFLDQAKKNELAIKGLSDRIDTLIFKIADMKSGNSAP